MSRKLLLGIALLGTLAVIAGTASAATQTFALRGNGSFMSHPPIFAGDVIYGTLSPGTFWVAFDDTNWPVDDPETPQNERMDYVLAHYFHYHSTVVGAEGWDGYFPPSGSGEPMARWRFKTTAGDTLGGSCTLVVITIRDYNADGIVQNSEYEAKALSANLIDYINYSGGCFRNLCGSGNLSGTLKIVNWQTMQEEWYVPSATSASGRLVLRDTNCTVGVESSSWGQIKSIYR